MPISTRAYTKRISGAQLAEGYFSPHIYPKELMKHFDNNFVMEQCVNRDWEGDIKGAGDVVHIRAVGNITISDYERYQDIEYQNLDEDETLLTIDQQKVFAYMIDVLDESDFDIPVLDKYTQRAAINLADMVDQYIYGVGTAGVDEGNIIGGDTDPIELTQNNLYRFLVMLYTRLERVNALKGQTPFLVCPPDLHALIKLCPQFVPVSTGGATGGKSDSVVRKGDSIGEIAGFQVKKTTNVSSDTNGVFQILAGTKEGITFAQKVAKVERLKQLEKKFGQAVRGLFYYGAKVIYPKSLAKIICTATIDTSSYTV